MLSTAVPEAEKAVPDKRLELGELPPGQTLGVRWDPQSDRLVQIDRPPAQITKRGLLKRLGTLRNHDDDGNGNVKKQ